MELINGWDQGAAPGIAKPSVPLQFLQSYGDFPTDYAVSNDPGNQFPTPIFWSYEKPGQSLQGGNDCTYAYFDQPPNCMMFVPASKTDGDPWREPVYNSGLNSFVANIMWTADGPTGGFWW